MNLYSISFFNIPWLIYDDLNKWSKSSFSWTLFIYKFKNFIEVISFIDLGFWDFLLPGPTMEKGKDKILSTLDCTFATLK